MLISVNLIHAVANINACDWLGVTFPVSPKPSSLMMDCHWRRQLPQGTKWLIAINSMNPG